MHLATMQDLAWTIAEEKHLHEHLDLLPPREATLIRLALIHSEVSEAVQLVKRHGIAGQEGAIEEELADIVIRVGDLAQQLALDLERGVRQKLGKNQSRPDYFGTPWEVPAALTPRDTTVTFPAAQGYGRFPRSSSY